MEEIEGEILRRLYERHRGEPGFPFVQRGEFEELVRKAYSILVNVAKEKPPTLAGRGLITYGEIGKEIGLDVISEWFKLKIAAIVGACSGYEYEKGRPLISSLSVSNDTKKPGKGYWGLRGIPARLRRKVRMWNVDSEDLWNDPKRLEFWASEVKKVYEQWENRDC